MAYRANPIPASQSPRLIGFNTIPYHDSRVARRRAVIDEALGFSGARTVISSPHHIRAGVRALSCGLPAILITTRGVNRAASLLPLPSLGCFSPALFPQRGIVSRDAHSKEASERTHFLENLEKDDKTSATARFYHYL